MEKYESTSLEDLIARSIEDASAIDALDLQIAHALLEPNQEIM